MLSHRNYCLCVVLIFLNIIIGIKSDFNVAVVEYQPIQDHKLTPEELLNKNTENYLKLLDDAFNFTDTLNFIVYPEATLHYSSEANFLNYTPIEYSSYVKRNESACLNDEYPKFMQDLSCAANNRNTFIIVNIIEKEKCENNDTDNCKNFGHYLYNTNVIFDENGVIVDRYRKYNLFGENHLDKPKYVETITFTILNDTFGIFTCFDILFEHPAIDLVNLGVRKFIFPTMWFSELPFLTALQVQFMWSFGNRVVLYASGANNPSVGSGGTGIYSDDPLPEFYGIVAEGGSKIYSVQSPEPNSKTNKQLTKTKYYTDDDIDTMGRQMDNFTLKSENLSNYSSIVLNTNSTNTQTIEVCSNALCCKFTIKIINARNLSLINLNKNHYIYHLVAFSGNRSFSGVADAEIQVCGVTACLNSSLESCGQRFPSYDTIEWPITFTNLVVEANFINGTHTKQYPNTLLSSIRPLSSSSIDWQQVGLGEGDSNQIKRVLTLTEPQNRLFAFGIYGRVYEPNAGHIFGFNSPILFVAALLLAAVR